MQIPKKKKELAKAIREKAAPLVKWLRTAEEESSSEDEVEVSDGEILRDRCSNTHAFFLSLSSSTWLYLQVEYSKTATGSIVAAETSPPEETVADIDIDAI